MDKQAQDKRWNELREETQKQYREDYSILCNEHPTGKIRAGDIREIIRITMENIFGSHNLNPKQIKTWEDVENLALERLDFRIDTPTGKFYDKIHDKLVATYKIAILIDLGYGGMVSEEEWEDDSMEKFKITPFKNGGFQVVRYYSIQHKDILSFRDRKIAEEFMSHESNRRLVRDYYLMEKGEGL